MSLFKCKMCGGTLEIKNETVAECEYCGTQQTLPKLNDERRANLYDRANHFRRNNEFDKAMGIYEQILNEDSTDSEVYWSLVLCRYGIEYVEDPTTHKRVPTVNRAQFTSIFDDDNYKSALNHADGYQKTIYEAEARAINEIQKGILAISQKEEPFDVFICYKETDNSGRRTPDSVLANDLYHQLTQEGFKVFFSRITLEDKLGTAYEPYIFAALNSAKVMIVLGTKPEYFKAVWVRNEWSRYLSLIKGGAKKVLIPAYKDMDPYDLPDEFSHLQAQDMGKLGFMQDILRGIKKITNFDNNAVPVESIVVTSNQGNANSLIKRAFLYLEDSEWKSADEYCERALDIDPENVQAYLGKMMACLRVSSFDDLAQLPLPFDDQPVYHKVIRYADENLSRKLQLCNDAIRNRNKQAKIEEVYNSAMSAMKIANTEHAWRKVANQFETIRDYQDAAALAEQCIYQAEQQKAKREAEQKKTKRFLSIAIPSVCILVAIIFILVRVIIPNIHYNKALNLMEEGHYEEAITEFQKMNGYKESDSMILECQYLHAVSLMQDGKYDSAREAFVELESYKDSPDQTIECYYQIALQQLNAGNYPAAITEFRTLGDYRDCPQLLTQCYKDALGEETYQAISNAKKGDTIIFGNFEQDNDKTNGEEPIEWYVKDVDDDRILLVSRYGLTFMEFGSRFWSGSKVRTWTNGTFYNSAFTKEQRTVILPTSNKGEYGFKKYGPSTDTTDYIFVLSQSEAESYFGSRTGNCQATAYAYATLEDTTYYQTYWWLRSPWSSVTPCLTWSGDGVHGAETYSDRLVRPAMWVGFQYDTP